MQGEGNRLNQTFEYSAFAVSKSPICLCANFSVYNPHKQELYEHE